MASSNTSDTASRANGLHERFQKGTTVLGLFLAKEVMMGLEGLNTSPQGRGKTIGGMLSTVDCVKKHFQSQRTEEAFITVYTSATDLVTSLDIEPIKMPHLRKPQRRHAGPAEPYVPSTDHEYYRVQFFQVLDIVTTQLTKRFEQEGLQHLVKLEKVLLSGQVNDVVDLYPELQFQSLKVQLAMFTANYTYKTCSEVTEIMRNMGPEVCGLFSQVEALLRLLLVVRDSSAEAERSFSALRRLKTWLCSSMSQPDSTVWLFVMFTERECITWTRRNCVKNLFKLLIGTCMFLGHFRISNSFFLFKLLFLEMYIVSFCI